MEKIAYNICVECSHLRFGTENARASSLPEIGWGSSLFIIMSTRISSSLVQKSRSYLLTHEFVQSSAVLLFRSFLRLDIYPETKRFTRACASCYRDIPWS